MRLHKATLTALAGVLFVTMPVQAQGVVDAPSAVSTAGELQAYVAWLADPAREGRIPGSIGHDQARDDLVRRFETIGLHPGGASGGYLQSFETPLGQGRVATAANVIGVWPGSAPELRDQVILVSAHYDHLGHDANARRPEDRGRLHPGADDNASGVAVLVALASDLAVRPLPRTVAFVAFSGEEQGAVGSRAYARSSDLPPAGRIVANVNLDMVGRLGDGPVQVLGTATSPDWEAVLTDAGRRTGTAVRLSAGGAGGSDQQSFITQSIPAVQVFTGGHADYHRPSDVADRIDTRGLLSVERFVADVVRELASQPLPLQAGVFERAGPVQDPSAPPRVSFGIVPDFSHVGAGVRVDGLSSDTSPGARAGLIVGDVITHIDDVPLRDLRHFAERLRQLAPGAPVTVRLVRDSHVLDLSVKPL